MIDWKGAARHYRFRMKLAEQHEITLKRRLWGEGERARIINKAFDEIDGALRPLLGLTRSEMRIASSVKWARRALAALGDEPTMRAITFTCRECGEYFDEPIQKFLDEAGETVLAPTLCVDCGHGEED